MSVLAGCLVKISRGSGLEASGALGKALELLESQLLCLLNGNRRFKASRASHGWEAVSNHMWPDKPVRQAREPSEEFVG